MCLKNTFLSLKNNGKNVYSRKLTTKNDKNDGKHGKADDWRSGALQAARESREPSGDKRGEVWAACEERAGVPEDAVACPNSV